MCNHLEQDIKSKLPNSNVTIHVEPCEIDCSECIIICRFAPNKLVSKKQNM
jgi:hypothetical protein